MAKAPIDIRSLARSHTQSAINVLVGIMEQEACPPAARVSAAQVLLDRGWGKAPATLTVEHKRINELNDDELAYIAVGRSEGAVEAAGDSKITH